LFDLVALCFCYRRFKLHINRALRTPLAPVAPPAAPLAPAALYDRSASEFGTNPFASFDALGVSNAHNEANNEA
jgi:hypothetical protein